MITYLFNCIKNLFFKTSKTAKLTAFEIVFLDKWILIDDRSKKLILYRVKREISIILRGLEVKNMISNKDIVEAMNAIKADVESNTVHIKIPSKVKIKLQKELSENYSIKII